MNKKIFTGLKYTGVVLLLLTLCFLLLRKNIYHYFLSLAQKKFSDRYHCRLLAEEIYPEGITGFKISGLKLVPESGDTLLVAEELSGSVRFWSLISGEVRLSSVSLHRATVHAIALEGKNNFAFLLKGRKEKTGQKSERNYAAIVNKILSAAFSSLPDYIEFRENKLRYTDEAGSVRIDIPVFEYNNSKVHGDLLIYRDNGSDRWIIDGMIKRGKENFEGKIYADKGAVVIPFLNEKYKLQCRFDTLYLALRDKDYDNDHLKLQGEVFFHNLYVRHPKLDSNAIGMKYVDADYIFDFGKESVSFESPHILLNKIAFNIKSGFSKKEKGSYFLEVGMKRISGQDFFNSLPEGLFSTFQGISCEGDIAYDLRFALDVSKPDCVKFDSRMTDYGFKIKKFGVTDFSKMTGPFLYTAYEKGRPVKSFVVGPVNPLFAPIEEISPYLKNAVLQSEDGSFYVHNGFREDAFRMAVAENVKQGRFARGGSTISMQLVKNVFLSRKKTVARKIEEALIVWMIERKRLTSKERMYEVYLNIIEWGPGIYGIGDAADFYFHKKPADLTIEESIYLASIIPKPKAFRWSFDKDGHLKSSLESYFRRISELLMRRGIITEEQRASVVADVALKGPAKNFIADSDSIEMEDSEDEDDIFEEEDRSEKKFFLFRKKKDRDKTKVREKESVKVELPKEEPKEEKKKKKWRLFK